MGDTEGGPAIHSEQVMILRNSNVGHSPMAGQITSEVSIRQHPDAEHFRPALCWFCRMSFMNTAHQEL